MHFSDKGAAADCPSPLKSRGAWLSCLQAMTLQIPLYKSKVLVTPGAVSYVWQSLAEAMPLGSPEAQKVIAETVCAAPVTTATAQCWRFSAYDTFGQVYHHLLIWFVAVIHVSKKSSGFSSKCFFFLCCVWIFTAVACFLRTEVQVNENGYQRGYKGLEKRKRFLSATTL